MAGLTTTTMKRANRPVSASVSATAVGDPLRLMATTAASRIQAATSSTAAEQRVRAPIGDLYRPRSTRIRASTGKAVTHIAAPMKSENATGSGWGFDGSTNTPLLFTANSGIATRAP